ncbi:hypothetical protein [Ignatzschineria indica]|nr:hypothetical protein [Ignatzschineria indica]
MILKRIRGTAGTDYFALITTACPQVGISDAYFRHAIWGRTR